MKKTRQISLLLLLVMFLSSVGVFASSKLELDVRIDKNTDRVEILVEGDREAGVNLIIKDDNRNYFIDRLELDKNGKGLVKTYLPKEKKYKLRAFSNGSIVEKNLETKLEVKDELELPIEEVKEKTINLYIEGHKGIIISKKNILVEMGESVLDVTKRILDANNIKYREKDGYMVSIDNQAEFDKGEGSGWMFSIDGKFPNRGADYLRAKDFKRIEWRYTYDLGEDIGAGKNWLKLEELGEDKIDRILKDLDQKNLKEKEVSKLLKELSKEIENISASKRLRYGEKIYDLLYGLENEFSSDNIACKIGEISLKITREISKNIEDKFRVEKLFKKNLALINTSLLKISSEKERAKLSREIIGLVKEVSSENKNLNKVKKSIIKMDVDGREEIKLSEDLILGLRAENIKNLRLENKNLNLEISLDNLGEAREIILLKNKISLKNKGELINLKYPIKIEIPSKNKDANIILKDEKGKLTNLGGVYFEKEGLIKAYTRSLGEFYLEENNIKFKDLVNYSWAKDSIEKLASKEIVKGVGNSKFSPESQVTRAEFSAMLVRMLKLDKVNGEEIFKDVTRDKWYYEDINSLYKKGYINGRSEKVFDPNGKISREEMSKILGKILEDYDYQEVDEKVLKEFKDYGKISPWAKDGASILVKNQALKGSGGNFNPKNPGTRAETASLIYRVYTLILED